MRSAECGVRVFDWAVSHAVVGFSVSFRFRADYQGGVPELAEVEFYRRQWDPGLGGYVQTVEIHPGKRVFRGTDVSGLVQGLKGVRLESSAAHGKQMIFRFSGGASLGVHLGMTGLLAVGVPGAKPGRHDHLILAQKERSLVFTDPRQFGRILFHAGPEEPPWWRGLPPALLSNAFTLTALLETLHRHARAPIKAVLLDQAFFPGLGNWMADEILWRASLHPSWPAGCLRAKEAARLWRCIRFVCRGALRHVAPAFGDPPPQWLFQHRWREGGRCPKDRQTLCRATIGGRTTAWCPRCQEQRIRRQQAIS